MRIDTAVYQGYEIPLTMIVWIAKVLVKGEDRKEAIQKMKVAPRISADKSTPTLISSSISCVTRMSKAVISI